MTPTPPEVVPAQVDGVVVTQADRDFAGEITAIQCGYYQGLMECGIRDGIYDNSRLVRAVAKFRTDSMLECADLANEQSACQGDGEIYIARVISEAIRQLSAPPPPPVDVGEGG